MVGGVTVGGSGAAAPLVLVVVVSGITTEEPRGPGVAIVKAG